jgi:hypothetical protein
MYFDGIHAIAQIRFTAIAKEVFPHYRRLYSYAK